ncbi:MAG: restriction endonuclease subunit S [Treponema sp.]|nr:restriction endonuclease subunit S [Treponema sp.]
MAQIKKDTSLRKAILQAAITGQLISSCHSELDSESAETGKKLLNRIIEERNNKLLAEWEEALNKNPKAKKPAPIVTSEIDEEETPFEIPENWCWCKLEDLVTILGDGLHGTPQYDISGEYYFVNGNNLNNGLIEIKPDTKKVNKKEYDKYKKELNETTIFVSINGTIGNIAFYNDEKIILGKSACYFNVAIKDLKKYFFYLFQADYFLTYALDNATGTTIKNVGLGTMRSFLLPLPPLAVQNAIVEKLEQVLPLVDAYENALLQKEELKTALPDKVKKAILQEAITGKLTESWRKSATIKESGKQLLDHIIEERNAKALAEWEEAKKTNPKAKKPAPVVASEIDEEEIPFEVPDSWCWCRLGDLVPFGQCENAEPDEIEDEAWILDLEDIEKDSGRILQFKTKKEVDSKSTKHIFKKDYVLYSKLRPYLNKCVIAPKDGYCTSEILPLDFGKFINNRYVQTFLMSPYFVDYTDSLSFGVKMPRLGTEDGKKALVPLPPLEEQEEIVKKVEELLPLCK